LACVFQFLNHTNRRQDSLGGGLALRKTAIYTGQQKHRINAGKHPCLEWDSNPRPQCLKGRG
jgi:hypothetical protein